MGRKLNKGQSRFLNISFEIEGEKQVSSAFDLAGEELKDLRKPLNSITNILLLSWQKNFKTEGSTLGKPWADYKSLKYKNWKQKNYPGKGILERTGTMKGHFKAKIRKFSTTLFNPTSYFKFHQSKKPREVLPRRIMMRIDQKRKNQVLEEFTKYLDEVRSHFYKK